MLQKLYCSVINDKGKLLIFYYFLSDHYYNSYDYIDYIDLELFLSTVYHILYIYKNRRESC